jgi:replicative DNA helicase
MSNLSKDLRTLQRLKKIPILAASQLNREESEDGPSTKNISESDRIGQDATTVLFIERKESNVTLTVGKARNARTGDKLTYAWNINMGILHYIPTEKDALQGEGSAEIIQQYSDMDKSSSVF